MNAVLALEDGTWYRGVAAGAQGEARGEVVFNTSMTGYQEVLTDPSYAGQIVTMTAPQIGNYGVASGDAESQVPHVAGFVMREASPLASNWRADGTLREYLVRHHVVAIADIDTRRLTRMLREKGAQSGCVMSGTINEAQALAAARSFPGLAGMDLAKEVTTREPFEWREGRWELGKGFHSLDAAKFRVVAYDYGIKRNILRLLAERGARITVVPAQTAAREVLRMKPDGVFLSNGPGDPEPCDYAIEAIGEILDATRVPVFGICLGHQLMGLASGAKTLKMKFGHHGANHPVKDLDTGQVVITSQNHGFAVDPASLPPTLRPTHVSLFDGSLQGLARTDRPAFCFQGHPEASPGPHDVGYLFDRFAKMVSDAQAR